MASMNTGIHWWNSVCQTVCLPVCQTFWLSAYPFVCLFFFCLFFLIRAASLWMLLSGCFFLIAFICSLSSASPPAASHSVDSWKVQIFLTECAIRTVIKIWKWQTNCNTNQLLVHTEESLSHKNTILKINRRHADGKKEITRKGKVEN